MANKNVFGRSMPGRLVPSADAVNAAGGKAYSLSAEAALAQVAATGTFNETYYGTPADQIKAIWESADKCSPEFIAQCAVYARRKGAMKDMPAALMVLLTKADGNLARLAFDHVIDNGKMLRNFVQMIRSGVLGRKSLGHGPKKLIQRWLNGRDDWALLRASVGTPSLGTILALSHPKPPTPSRAAFYGYLRGFEAAQTRDQLRQEWTDDAGKTRAKFRYLASDLPDCVKQLEAFRRGEGAEVPNVDMRLLDGFDLKPVHWAQVARRGRFIQTFKSLNTYLRHDVFQIDGMVDAVAGKLRDRAEILGSRVFPYQIMNAYNHVSADMPAKIKDALQDALEIATEKVEGYGVPCAVLVDVSGSMQSPITGHRQGATTTVRCVDVAGLIGAVVLRKNRDSVVVPVDDDVKDASGINPRDSVLTIAKTLASFGGGGTALSRAIEHLNRKGSQAKLLFLVSDMETWADPVSRGWGMGTEVAKQFAAYKARVKDAKLVTLNLQAATTTQVVPSGDVLNIGGFSDNVFEVVGKFVRGEGLAARDGSLDVWVNEIKAIDLRALARPQGAPTVAEGEEEDKAE